MSNTLATWCKELTHWKDPDAGKDCRQEEKETTNDETVGWHHQLNGYEFEQALGIGGGQGSLVYCSPWGRKALDMTEQLNWTDKRTLHEHLLSALLSYYYYWETQKLKNNCTTHQLGLFDSDDKKDALCKNIFVSMRLSFHNLAVLRVVSFEMEMNSLFINSCRVLLNSKSYINDILNYTLNCPYETILCSLVLQPE